MTIKNFIQKEILLPRLKQNGVLIVYDPDQRYRELCLELNWRLRVSKKPKAATSRFAALDALSEFTPQPIP